MVSMGNKQLVGWFGMYILKMRYDIKILLSFDSELKLSPDVLVNNTI